MLPNSLREQFLILLNQQMSPCYPDPTTRFTMIESVYLDTQDLQSFRNHFQKLAERFKLRTRRYGPNGNWKDSALDVFFLELKTKRNEITDKVRLKLDDQDRSRLMAGSAISTNQSKEKKIQISQKINSVIQETKPIPVSEVVYRRFAFEDCGLRVTVDDQLSVKLRCPVTKDLMESLHQEPWWEKAMAMAADYTENDVSLVEVKHSGIVPSWLIQFMVQNNLQYGSFSKYCFSIVNALKGIR